MFPAPAGMNRQILFAAQAEKSVPRACGDEPVVGGGCWMFLYVFPAPAGMNRLLGSGAPGGRRVPRACGDEPKTDMAVLPWQLCSPRLRG